MTDMFLSQEHSLKLKELEFDEPCFAYYVDGELRGINLGLEELGGVKPYYQRFGFHTLKNSDIDNSKKIVVTSPTCEQVIEWLERKHYIYIDRKSVTSPEKMLGFEYWLRSTKVEPRYVGIFKNDIEGKKLTIELSIMYLTLLKK